MRYQGKLCVAAIVCLIAGCNQPAVTPKAPAFQASANTVRDWNDVASKIAAEMAVRGLLPNLPGAERPATSYTAPARPVFVHLQAPDSAFLREVAGELESDILQRGGIVARTPTGATVVNLDVDFVRWSPRDKPPGLALTTAAVMAIPGIIIGTSAPMSPWAWADTASFAALGYGILGDALIAITPTMNAEAIWQATIVTDDTVVMRLQEPIYIRTDDIALYATATSVRPVASWGASPPLRSRTLRYDP